MIWLRLVWYFFWRGLLYGGIAGIVFGTLISPYDGTIYGVVIGTVLGAALGLMNGVVLIIMTRLFFPLLNNRARYIGFVRIAITPIDSVIVFIYLMSVIGYIAIIPAVLAGMAIFSQSARFADYAIAQLSTRNGPANVLS